MSDPVAALPPEVLAVLQDPAKLAQVIPELWRRGNLRYKLHDTQLKIDGLIQGAFEKDLSQFFLLCSRRLGKSFYLLVKAFEKCLQKPGARVLYLAPFAKDAQIIVTDTAELLLQDCPPQLRPDFKTQDREFHFRNGSILRLRGTNSETAQNLRGGHADLIILDECAIMDDLAHVLNDVAMPMTLTTNGQILLATTPPRTPGHESIQILEHLAGLGASAHFTIRDAPHLDHRAKCRALVSAGEKPERVEAILAGTLEPETTTARREYFCEIVTDAGLAVVKEYTAAARKDILKEHTRPPYFDAYTAMDPGMKDRTGLLFGYWDFRAAKLVIEDEALLSGPNTPQIAAAIAEKELELWGGRPPYCRVSDNDLRLIADLYAMHRLLFTPTKKGAGSNLDDINLVRSMVQAREIIIHPRCVHLDRQLKNAIWNTKATDFARVGGEDAVDGHFDLVASLKYLCRCLNKQHNPYPDSYFFVGAPGGPPVGSWQNKNRQPERAAGGLMSDTPYSKRIQKLRAARMKGKY